LKIELPAHATVASLRRAEIAERLANACPPELADEIALVGSTARGFADDDSDLELNLWAESIPPLDAWIAWLQAAGADEIDREDVVRPDNSYWLGFRLGDVPCEIGWQTFAAAHDNLDRILSGAVIDRKFLFLADIIASAIPLRTSGRLAEWQRALSGYSDAVQMALITSALERWTKPGYVAGVQRLARRGERLALAETLLADLNAALRVIYAAHRRWEPSNKWTLTVAREFAPFDLDARIDAILGDPSLERRVALCAQFCLEVLALVPPQYNVSVTVAALRAALD
jgi:hypothetical protein